MQRYLPSFSEDGCNGLACAVPQKVATDWEFAGINLNIVICLRLGSIVGFALHESIKYMLCGTDRIFYEIP